jgi:hypothetical protein
LPQQIPLATIGAWSRFSCVQTSMRPLAGMFDLNAKLATIREDILAIRRLLEDDEGEEEAEGDA